MNDTYFDGYQLRRKDKNMEYSLYEYLSAQQRAATAPFLVFNATKGGAPTFKHPTRSSAEAEARRLANLNPGQAFYVLGSVSVTQAPKAAASTRSLV